MASNEAEFLGNCFIRGNDAHFRCNRWEMCRLPCSKNAVENKLKYNLSGSVYLLQGANVTGISTKWFLNFQRLESSELIFPTGVENWFEFAGVSNNRGFEKSGVKLQCQSEANPIRVIGRLEKPRVGEIRILL